MIPQGPRTIPGWVSGPICATGMVVLLGVGGCSPVGQPPTPQTASPGVDLELVEQAHKADADPSQIAILEKGEVSFADYEAATNRALACMRQAGIDVLGPEVTDRTGLRMLDYGWSSQVDGLSDEQGKQLGEGCLTRFSDFVDTQYQLQSSSVEAREQYFVKFRPAVVECIRANGGTVEDEPTRDEAMTASFPILDNSGVDCFEKSGVSMS